MPKISVIIPTYNSVEYLSESIDSVLSQDYKEFEIIVVDDGSTDNTRQIIDKYLKSHSDIVSYFIQKNTGPAGARNLGIKMAKGGYIAFQDSDDIWLPEKLKRSLRFLEINNYDWISTATRKKEGENEEVRYLQEEYLDDSGVTINLLKNGLFFFSSVPIYLPSVVAKKDCFKRVGLFDQRFKVGEDTDMWLRFEEADLKGGYLKEPLLIYRMNHQSVTKSNKIFALKEHLRLARKHARLLGIHKPLIKKSYSEFLWKSADALFHSGQYFDSLKCLLKSFFLFPEKEKIFKITNFIKNNTLKT